MENHHHESEKSSSDSSKGVCLTRDSIIFSYPRYCAESLRQEQKPYSYSAEYRPLHAFSFSPYCCSSASRSSCSICSHLPPLPPLLSCFGSIDSRFSKSPGCCEQRRPSETTQDGREYSTHKCRSPATISHLRSSRHHHSGSVSKKHKRHRTAFTPTQLLGLEDAFERNHYLVGEERKQLATYLKLSETQIKVWFQNRRTKWKRQRNNPSEDSDDDDSQCDIENCQTCQERKEQRERLTSHEVNTGFRSWSTRPNFL